MSIFQKRHEFIMEEKDVTFVLDAINRSSSVCLVNDLAVANCGGANNDSSKWFISFYSSGKRYEKILKNILKKGNLTILRRPGGQEDLYVVRAN